MKDFTEQEIILGCVKEDGRFQRLLFEKYYSKMFAICIRFSQNEEEAKDILQDGFVKVFQNLGKFKGTGAFEGWLRRIFVNTAIEHYRKKNDTYEIKEAHEEGITDRDLTALDKLAADDIVKMISELPNGYRTVFNLFAVEGYAHKEIAEMLKISEGTSKSQFARAKAWLQEKIGNRKNDKA